MKRRSEHLVQKRDGRLEFLRSTKLARSIHLALRSVGVDEDWRALEITTAVLTGLRVRQGVIAAGGGISGSSIPVSSAPASGGDGPPVLTTTELATAVQHVLVATGHPAAAVAFDAVAIERLRRRSVLASADRGLGINEGLAVLPSSPVHNRLPRE